MIVKVQATNAGIMADVKMMCLMFGFEVYVNYDLMSNMFCH